MDDCSFILKLLAAKPLAKLSGNWFPMASPWQTNSPQIGKTKPNAKVSEQVPNPEAILDASAVLAWLQEERGSDKVDEVLDRAAISAVNATEVVHKLINRGATREKAQQILDQMSLPVLDFTEAMSRECAGLSHHADLALGDRACLATGITLGIPVFTADRRWKNLLPTETVQLIRS